MSIFLSLLIQLVFITFNQPLLSTISLERSSSICLVVEYPECSIFSIIFYFDILFTLSPVNIEFTILAKLGIFFFYQSIVFKFSSLAFFSVIFSLTFLIIFVFIFLSSVNLQLSSSNSFSLYSNLNMFSSIISLAD